MAYLRRVYRLPADLEEAVVADLWLAGTMGVRTEVEAAGVLRLTAYFSLQAAPAPPAISVAGNVEWLAEEELPEIDWMAEYRRLAHPFALGRTLLVDPREPEDAEAPGEWAGLAAPHARRRLRLPARTAFGTGSHESTSLAIELLEGEQLSNRTVLDVGTGTGVLAFAALAWGAARVVGFDADVEAAFQARANSRLNGLYPRLFAGRLAALSARLPHSPSAGRFDLALINVVPEQILPEIADLLPVLGPAGGVILSGLLAERAPEVLARLAALGFAEADRRQAGEWVALRLARMGPALP